MESTLTNIAVILGIAAQTEGGRAAINELGANLQTYAAEKSRLAASVAAALASPAVANVLAPASSGAAASGGATAPAPAVPAVKKPTPVFPTGYTILADNLKEIVTKYASKISAATDLLSKAVSAFDMYYYIAYEVPGVLINPYYKSAHLENITNLIDELINAPTTGTLTPDQLTQINTYIRNFEHMKYNMNLNLPVKYSWHTADGFRITVVQTYEGAFREIRRGDLTGKDLRKAGVMTWKSADELMEYWQDNNITNSDIATAYDGY
jgi:hypothetical protein